MVPLNLAPNLPDSLRLPRNLGRWNGATVDVRFITMELLVAFGLNYIEANLLFYRVLQLKDSPEPRFDAVPQDPNLPATKTGNSQSPVAAISGRDKCFVFPFKEVDRPEFGIFSFSAVIQLATSKKEALKTFSEWYDKQRAALGIGNWKQPGRDPIRFLRDLIVYEFRAASPEWDIIHFDDQMEYMGLPRLTNRPRGNSAQEIARRIRFDVAKLIEAGKFPKMSASVDHQKQKLRAMRFYMNSELKRRGLTVKKSNQPLS